MEGYKDSNKRYPMVAYGLGTLTIRKTMKNQCHSPPAHWKASLAQNVNASMPGCPNRRTPDIFADRLSPQLTFGWLLFHRILKNAVILSVMNNYDYDIQHSSTFHNPYKAAPAFQKANRKNTDLQDSAARISKELHNLQNLQSQDATTGNHKSIWNL